MGGASEAPATIYLGLSKAGGFCSSMTARRAEKESGVFIILDNKFYRD